MKAKLILENGDIFIGKTLGYVYDAKVGELVFNTSMGGFQEIITDPSYCGQIIAMSYPLVGNYGFNSEDIQALKPSLCAFIVKEDCKFPSNFRCEMTLRNYLIQYKIAGMKGIDTRALIRVSRINPGMPAILTTKDLTIQEIRHLFAHFSLEGAIAEVSCKCPYDYTTKALDGLRYNVAVVDYGVKQSILENFAKRKCFVRVFPYDTAAEELQEWDPDIIFLSNGPGDPKSMYTKLHILEPFLTKKPILGICFGHQLLSLFSGGETERLEFGHRGGNQPVLDIESDKILITAQNHGFYASRLPKDTRESHRNLIDYTNEGMVSEKLGIKSVQFHPEAGPGPNDANKIFDDFLAFADNFYKRSK